MESKGWMQYTLIMTAARPQPGVTPLDAHMGLVTPAAPETNLANL